MYIHVYVYKYIRITKYLLRETKRTTVIQKLGFQTLGDSNKIRGSAAASPNFSKILKESLE